LLPRKAAAARECAAVLACAAVLVCAAAFARVLSKVRSRDSASLNALNHTLARADHDRNGRPE